MQVLKKKIKKIKYLSKLELKEWRKEIPSNNSDNRRYDVIIVTDKHYNFSDLGFSIYNRNNQYITMDIGKKVTTYRIKNGSLSVNDFFIGDIYMTCLEEQKVKRVR